MISLHEGVARLSRQWCAFQSADLLLAHFVMTENKKPILALNDPDDTFYVLFRAPHEAEQPTPYCNDVLRLAVDELANGLPSTFRAFAQYPPQMHGVEWARCDSVTHGISLVIRTEAVEPFHWAMEVGIIR